MNVKTGLTACAVLWMAAIGVSAQDAAEILRSHGGAALERLDEYAARGVVDTPEGSLDFVLKVSGDRSRLEVGQRVFVRQGAVGSWRSGSGRWSEAGRVWEGLRDVYLLPLFPVRELGFFQRRPGEPGASFRRVVPRRGHVGYQAPRPVVDLVFDAPTGLLSEGVFGEESGGQSPVRIRYAEYRREMGIALPGLVSRQVGDGDVWTFRFDEFDLRPNFGAGDFDLAP